MTYARRNFSWVLRTVTAALAGALVTVAAAAQANQIVGTALPFDEFGHLANTADDRSAATSTINAFQYLMNSFAVPLVPGAGSDLASARDALESGWNFNGQHRAGMLTSHGDPGAFQRIWESTVTWVQDFAAGAHVTFAGMLLLPGTDLTQWTLGSSLSNYAPNWNFIYGQIEQRSEVEIGFTGTDVNGEKVSHAITLTNASLQNLNGKHSAASGAPLLIDYLDPDNPLVPLESPVWIDKDGWLHFTWDNGTDPRIDSARIDYVFAQHAEALASVPEPATLMLLMVPLALFANELRSRKAV